MPLLKRKAFEKSSVSEYLRDDDEVFHCEITDEIFKDYEEYCERIILVNSMVWTCEMTGKNNLTYAEALESEKAARRQLKDFPLELRIPILYLATKTKRSSFAEMSEDLFNYVRERYFVGEVVEACLEGDQWAEAQILSVTSQKQLPGSNTILPAASYIYEVEQFNDSDSGGQIGSTPHDRVRRRKGIYTRDKNRLFLKQFVEQGPGGIICIKKAALDKYNISKVNFEQIFTGNPPVFAPSKKLMKTSISPTKNSTKPGSATKLNKSKKATPDKRGKQESMDKFIKKTDKNDASKPKQSPADTAAKRVQQQQLLDKMRKAEDQLRQKREDEKAMKKEKNAKLQAYIKEWQKVKEDLELEDHKIIPKGTPVEVPGIDQEHFGDILSILEFVHNFSDILKVKEFFHYDLDLDTLRKAFTMPEHAGLLCDLVQMFLTTIFQLQEDEAEEYNENGHIQEFNAEEGEDDIEMDANREMELATKASKWSHTYLGMPLSKLPLDPTTVSEVLRLHLLSSGGSTGSRAATWRYQQRGGYSSRDDPAISLRRNCPSAVRELQHSHIAQISTGDMLQIIQCLMNQLLSYAAFRDVIEENLEDYKTKKHTLRTMQINERKREIQLVAARQELKKETAVKKEENKLKGEAARLADEELKSKIEKMNEESEEKRKEYEKKLKQLQDELFEYAMYLGSDRAYRRYYIGRRVCALFAEAGPETRGPCRDKPAPIHPPGDHDDVLAYVTRLFDEREKGGSDKENDSGASSRGNSPKKPLSHVNGLAHKLSALEPAAAYSELMVCSGENSTCYVHGKSDRPRWWVYHTEEQIDALIQSLNKRGQRESELKQALEQDKASLVEYVKKCPIHMLNPGVAEAPVVHQHWTRRKVQPSLVVPENVSVSEAIELSLRDHILELEEKIFHGCLGTIKVKDREAWRGTIMVRGYDKQAEYLSWGPQKQFTDAAVVNGGEQLHNGTPPPAPKVIKYRDPGRHLQTLESSPAASPSAASLAAALLQVEQAVHHKYLKRPLGLDEKERKDREAKNKPLDLEALERWEVSLMRSHSFAQIVLHLLALDSSIMWSASIFNASCKLCRRKTDPDNMLLCDGCNKGHHLYCLKPKLTKVPEGDWFCEVCKPKPVKERTPRKKRKLFSDDDIDDELNSSDEVPSVCGWCGSGGRLRAACALCAAAMHQECAPRRRALCADCSGGRARGTSSRRCAAAAISNIHMYTKALNNSSRNSSDSEDSEYNTVLVKLKQTKSRGSKDVSPAPNGARKRGRKSKEESFSKKNKHSLTNGHAEDSKPSRRRRNEVKLHPELLAQLLKDADKHKDSWPFHAPVDVQEVPDYLDIIETPMDLSIIRSKLEQQQYSTDEELVADLALIFTNCYTYNIDTHPVARAGYRFEKYLQKRCSELELPQLPEITVEDDEDSKKRRKSSDDSEAPKAKKAKLK